ncbi:MAG: DUF2804 domain-containing protein [Bacilli bacterium]|nr:DUF2804 domain-containing protein [Bacilli bacterium]
MKQHMLNKGPLLDDKGNLIEAGYAFSLVKEYNRQAIKGLKSRIKEWDYYFINDNDYGVALTIDDNSYMGLVSVSVLDFKNKKDVTKSYMSWLTFGKTNFPSSSENGDIFTETKNYSMYFQNKNGKRHLVCKMKNVSKGKDFECDIVLNQTLDKSMVISTPFRKKRHFYYNQKINLLSARGYFKYGDLTHQFDKQALGVLDWGRGVWTYSNTWYWSSLNASQEGHRLGFNLGYGFGDTSYASENMFFYDDEAYKLDDVVFVIPKDNKNKLDFLSNWTLKSKNNDIDLIFEPIIDRYSNTNALIIQSNQHQVFGYFSGSIKVNYKIIKLDHLLGFAEMVKNRW